MTKIKEEAVELLKTIPDDKVVYIIKIMEGLKGLYDDTEQMKREEAFARLEQLCKPVKDLDYDKALAEYREEKYS